MALTPGTRLGVYEVTTHIGAGGMGEVYRATDTNLKRQVAIKVLPPSLAADADRLARFQREAEVLASLNHPNIAAIYGLEESGGMTALVMEFVEGDDLSQRIARGALTLDEGLPIAKQIAEALEAAHDQGIIHRDLKPANIKLRPDGTVKVLDFGLAKAMDSSAPAGALADSGAVTSPAMMTKIGVILGTPAYMSPEQARANAVDRRTDIWAFGCVLYEMLAGKRAFGGDEAAATVAEVLKGEPDWTALPPETPPLIKRLLQGCLARDPRNRVPTISVARFEVDAAIQQPRFDIAARPASPRRHAASRLAVIVAAVSAVTAVGTWMLASRVGRPVAEPDAVVQFPLLPPAGVQFASGIQPFSITPDGSRIVFAAETMTERRYYVRPLTALEATPIRGTEGIRGSVFMSPNSQWFAVIDVQEGTVKKVRIEGGSVETLCRLSTKSDGGFGGASWGPRGTIVFKEPGAPGLMMVSETGGVPQVLTSPPSEEEHAFPFFLADGRKLLLTIISSQKRWEIAILDVESGAIRTLLPGRGAQYVSSGHLLFANDDRFWAVRFDPKTLQVDGAPVPVLEGISSNPVGRLSVAQNGTLVYGRGSGDRPSHPVLVDAAGLETPLPNLPILDYHAVRISPSGDKIAFATHEVISVYDVARATLTRSTSGSVLPAPLWNPDGARLVFFSLRERGVYEQRADGSAIQPLFAVSGDDRHFLVPNAFTPDLKRLLVTTERFGNEDVSLLTLGQQTIEPLLNSEFSEAHAALSPSGRWIAYHANQSGEYEVYVDRFPALGDRQRVSTSGGRAPTWSADGTRLFYTSNDGRQMFEVTVSAHNRLSMARPRKVFEGSYRATGIWAERTYDVMPDDKHFVMLKREAGTDSTAVDVVVVQNWVDELNRRQPGR